MLLAREHSGVNKIEMGRAPQRMNNWNHPWEIEISSSESKPIKGLGMLSSPSSAFPTVQGRLFLLHSRSKLRPQPDGIAITNRTKGQAFRLLANPNVSSGRENPINDVVMVDPVEAKRLAAKQMQQLKAKEKFQRRREIEAINGAWAMIGLTAGLVIEGQTGKSILGQLGGYLEAVFSYFLR